MTHRFSAAFLILSGLACSTAAHAQLSQVHAVYLLPMGGGLDQYLATRLVEMHLFQVVTDPKRADAVFVDRIGEGLEDKLAELYPEEKKLDKEAEKEKEKEKDKKDEWLGSEGSIRVGSTNLQRGKGTIFLIDRRNHTVIWSLYSPGKSGTSTDVNRNAESIAKKLAIAVKGTEKP
ncbi:MAG TPA: hypothetical protein VGL53_04900 [Bryobacteraceae bacterium]